GAARADRRDHGSRLRVCGTRGGRRSSPRSVRRTDLLRARSSRARASHAPLRASLSPRRATHAPLRGGLSLVRASHAPSRARLSPLRATHAPSRATHETKKSTWGLQKTVSRELSFLEGLDGRAPERGRFPVSTFIKSHQPRGTSRKTRTTH